MITIFTRDDLKENCKDIATSEVCTDHLMIHCRETINVSSLIIFISEEIKILKNRYGSGSGRVFSLNEFIINLLK